MFFSKFELRNQNQFSEKQNVFSSHIPAYTTRAPAITSKELFQRICFKCSILTFAKTLTSCSVQLCFVLITQTKTSAYICMGCCFLRTGECPENHLKVIIFMNQNFVTSFSGFLRFAHGDTFFMHYITLSISDWLIRI